MPYYTKNGDEGKTTLYKGNEQKFKSSEVFDVLGTLDELNASLGFQHISHIKSISRLIIEIQNELFVIGSIIAKDSAEPVNVEYWENKIERMEKEIIFYDKDLPGLSSFVIPGGTSEAVHLHVSRTIARRLERRLVSYINSENKRNYIILEKYINRLSDLLFVLSRYANNVLNTEEVFVKNANII
ncbi:cob(I)yrinic acid a,c-diamide adenosyltransferase [Patescibacteria group bacterium]|nr:cob(I)yrinic acid a,c-diamide adenosyltransferase [Patescibacteria group bacterium]